MDLKNIFKYLAYFMIIGALFIGTKMVKIIQAGEEIPEMLISAHAHVLGMSMLALLLYLDIKTKNQKNIKMPYYSGEASLGAVAIGTLLAFSGFMLMAENIFALGGMLSYIGESLIIIGMFLFVVASIIVEVLK